MKKKTAILLVGALALTAVLSGCGKNKEATEAANESVESEDPEGKAKNCLRHTADQHHSHYQNCQKAA